VHSLNFATAICLIVKFIGMETGEFVVGNLADVSGVSALPLRLLLPSDTISDLG
jgi:hypothetical protein